MAEGEIPVRPRSMLWVIAPLLEHDAGEIIEQISGCFTRGFEFAVLHSFLA